MRLVLVALAVLGVAGVVAGTVAHVTVLLGGPPGWLEPIAAWLTPQAVICIGLGAFISRWQTGDWIWGVGRDSVARRRWWPPGWPPWTKWVGWGYMAYAVIQWVREGRLSPLALTALWMCVYGTILLSSLYMLSVRDDTTLETPGDSFPRP